MTHNVVIRLYQAPEKLNLSASTIRRLIKEGKLSTIKLSSRATGILQSEIDRYLAEISAQ